MKKIVYTIFAATLVGVISFAGADGANEIKKKNGKAGMTGSPGEQNCTSCHNGAAVNSGGGSISIAHNVPTEGYSGGQTYQISVTVAQSGISLFGFDFEALKNNGNTNAGTLIVTNSVESQLMSVSVSGQIRSNIVHKTNGGAAANTKTFAFNWTAPASGTGAVTFYASGVAGNANNSDSGDKVYTTSTSITEKVNVGIENESNPSSFRFYPNPVSENITIQYNLQEPQKVEVSLYDLNGKEVANFYSSYQNTGEYSHVFQVPADLNSGIYLLNFKSGNDIKTEKLFLKK